jgi:hypothetical protein
LERQVNSLLFERLARSRDKQGVLRLARKGQEVQTAPDVIKDPVVLEFVSLPESPRLVESDLEQALLSNLQSFLLELGKGFAFVTRQQRLTLEGDHFYVTQRPAIRSPNATLLPANLDLGGKRFPFQLTDLEAEQLHNVRLDVLKEDGGWRIDSLSD